MWGSLLTVKAKTVTLVRREKKLTNSARVTTFFKQIESLYSQAVLNPAKNKCQTTAFKEQDKMATAKDNYNK